MHVVEHQGCARRVFLQHGVKDDAPGTVSAGKGSQHTLPGLVMTAPDAQKRPGALTSLAVCHYSIGKQSSVTYSSGFWVSLGLTW